MKIFISGIDTDTGKSIVTGLLAKYLLDQKQSVITQKYVQTGCTDMAEDLITHRQIMGIPLQKQDKEGITCSYLFKHPASPHLSAEMEGVKIESKRFTQASKQLENDFDYVLMEGAGGLMVPFNDEELLIDYVHEQKFPVILVSSSKLGSINHTLLSLEALKHRNIELIGLIYNQYPNTDALITKDSEQMIQKLLKKTYPDCPFISVPEIELEKAPSVDFKAIFENL